MRLKDFFDMPTGFRFMFNNLDTCSSSAKRHFAYSEFLTSTDDIKNSYSKLSIITDFINSSEFNLNIINNLRLILSDLKEINSTLDRLIGETSLDDIELFEIKSFAILSEKIRAQLSELPSDFIQLHDLNKVINILDPDNSKSTSFYIFDSYSKELALARNQFLKDPKNYDLYDRTLEIENEIRTSLSLELKDYIKDIQINYIRIIDIDIFISKSIQVINLGLSIPEISENKNIYIQLFNPEVNYYLEQSGKKYQKINFELDLSTVLVTGANMGGKTVLLKTLALTHILFHFGMGIPAEQAKICPIDDLFLITGDDQNTKMGYSSFSGEIIKINNLLNIIKSGKRVIALIDEPARSTNPLEGAALVSALIERLSSYKSYKVITTHYNIANNSCKRIRIKGLIGGSMDYTLIEDSNNEAPQEAINIARSLGADNEWIEIAEKMFSKNQ